MGCLSLSVSQVPPTVAVSAEAVNGVGASASGTGSRPEVTATSLNGIGATTTKMYGRARATEESMNAAITIGAWLVCNVSTSGMYLAVNEGLILTLDNGYLVVRRA